MKIKRNIYLLYGISLLQGMVFYGPIATLYRQSAGVSVFQITIIESISLALCIALEIPWGVTADRIGYKKTMVICCILYVLSKIVFWKAQGFGGFLLERVMLSAVMSGLSGCDVSILYLSCKEGESHKVFGMYNLLCTVGLLIASLVYSTVIKEDFRLAGFLTVITYGVAAILSLGLKEVKKENESVREKGEFWDLLCKTVRDRRFLLVLIGMAFLGETNQTITVFLNQLQYTRCGIRPTTMGYIYILVTLTRLIGAWSSGFTKKLGMKSFTLLMFGLAAISCFALAWTDNGIISIFCIVILHLAASLFSPLQMEIQNRHVKSGNRATVLSIYAVLIEGTGVFTNVMFGYTAQLDLSYSMMFGSLLCVCGGIFFLWWYSQEGAGGVAGR